MKGDGGIAGREYWYGDTALAEWIGDLRNFRKADKETQKGIRSTDHFVYESLYNARFSAAWYLREWSCMAGDSAATLLKQAMSIYEKERDLLNEWRPEKRGTNSWTKVSIDKEIGILAEVRELDNQAIAIIEKALEVGKVEVKNTK